ncbi:UNVERIFIED_CONTAM: hypothetical protein PYX00_006877 [Menopon gallinae]|uniref:mRNA-capping enzyme n=1 Tax=Menopon gallinae TaxID=328185 RepID=A0AAW2HY45_9NEOP
MGKKKIPRHWTRSPKIASELVAGKFLPFKNPLNEDFNPVPQERFEVSSVFDHAQENGMNIGLWIDLTMANDRYDADDVRRRGCRYYKLPLNGGRQVPQGCIDSFIRVCSKYIETNPDGVIGVHCTHGLNRTGFMIISYMVMVDNWAVTEAIGEFARIRPPGIRRKNYIHDLCDRFNGGILVDIPEESDVSSAKTAKTIKIKQS